MSKLWLQYKHWSKHSRVYLTCTGTGLICTGTGSVLDGCTGTSSGCTGTGHQKMPRMCIFLPFLHVLIRKSTQCSINTSRPLQFISKSIFLLKSSSLRIFPQKSSMNFSQNNSNMGHNPYTNQTQGFVRVYSKP